MTVPEAEVSMRLGPIAACLGVVKTEEDDTAAELVDPDYHVYHQSTGLLGDGNGAAIASRWPIQDVQEVDQQLSKRTADFPATTLIAQVEAPEPIGPLLLVDHLPSWKPQLELERSCKRCAGSASSRRQSPPGRCTSSSQATSMRRQTPRASASSAATSRSTA